MTAISLLGSVAIAFVAPTLPVGAPTRAVVSMVAPKWAQPQSLIATFLAAAVAIAPMDAADNIDVLGDEWTSQVLSEPGPVATEAIAR